MNYTTVYVGMDVHKDSFTLCCYTKQKETPEYLQRVEADYSKILKYLEAMKYHYGEDAEYICGYEAGCLGYTLFHDLLYRGIKCIVIAPTSIPVSTGKKKMKTDRRDAANIARCLAHNDYSPVNIPTTLDQQTKEYIRMLEDHRMALKKVKQQILSFCLRNGYQYKGGGSNWTQKHLKWLHTLRLEGLLQEVMQEYLITYEQLDEKINRIEKRLEELASRDEYKAKVSRLSCFLGIKTHTALSIISETGDFKRFGSASHYASYLGLVPGEHSSGEESNRLGITKAGNKHIRTLLIESANAYNRGQIGHKSKTIKERQEGNPPEIIAYADKANERLRRKYYHMVLSRYKSANVAKTAIARELACFIWGMMTDNIA